MPRRVRSPWPPLPRRKRGSGSTQRLADGRIRARLPVHISPTRQSREFPPDALASALAWLDAAVRPSPPRAIHTGQTTVEVWTGAWWATYVDGVKAPNTARAYLAALRKLEPAYATELVDLRASVLQRILRDLRRDGRSARTCRLTLTVWRECFEAAIDDDLLARNPTRRLAIEREAHAPPMRRTLSAAELRVLRTAITDTRFEAAYVLILECGLRFGEVHGLRWDHVDLDGARVHVEHQYTGGRWRALPKGRNPHWIEIPPDVVRVLRRHLADQPDGSVLLLQQPHPLRRARRGHAVPWGRSTILRDFQAVAERLKLDGVVPHAARHGLASYWLEHGVSAPEIARRLGHRRVDTTLHTYAHSTDESRQRASELVEGLFPGDTGDNAGDADDTPIESAS